MKYTLFVTFGIFSILILIGCKANPYPRGWDKKNTYKLTDEDTIYDNAVATARRRLPEFIADFEQKDQSKCDFYVNYELYGEDFSESLWFKVDSIIGKRISARLANVPQQITTLKYKQRTNIELDSIQDWLIRKDEKVIKGQFTEVVSKKYLGEQ